MTGTGESGEAIDGNDPETVRVWMVERGYTDRDLVTLVYATPDGERALRNERAATSMTQGSGVSAARNVDPGRLSPVSDAETMERYRREAKRTIEGYDPNETI